MKQTIRKKIKNKVEQIDWNEFLPNLLKIIVVSILFLVVLCTSGCKIDSIDEEEWKQFEERRKRQEWQERIEPKPHIPRRS